MIDFAVGIGMALSGDWAGPGVSAGVGWRPKPAVEIQALASGYLDPGVLTVEGEAMGEYIWAPPAYRMRTSGELTAGVFPIRVKRGEWTLTAGVRVGGAAVVRTAEFYGEPPDALRPALVVAAVAEAAHQRHGLRLKLGRAVWLEPSQPWESVVFLLPSVEGFLRW